MGLGLAIVNQLVELFKGTIECKSILGKGTRFVVKLPMVEATISNGIKNGEHVLIDESAIQAPMKGNLNVLVVEDNDLNRNLFVRLLEMLSMQYDVAENGKQALEKLETSRNNNPFDVILLDIQMPVMDGITCLKEIRSSHNHRDIYVIALTAHALHGDEEHLRMVSFNDYISKPVDVQFFLKKMDSLRDVLCKRKK